jgi:DNA polymerase-3 subunit delta'
VETDVAQLVQALPWQRQLWQRLVDQHNQQRLPHALLLCGDPGLGKAQLAKALGQYLLCQQPQGDRACGQCKSCLLNQQGTHPDLIEIVPDEPGKPIKVDQIRALVGLITSSAQQGGYRVVTLGPAEAMNVNAANALLKVLEEPGERTLFALYSHIPGRIPATVRSRCQSLLLSTPDAEVARQWLSAQTDFDADPVESLQMSGGAPLAALEQVRSGSAEQRSALYQVLKHTASGQGNISQGAEKLAKADVLEQLGWWLTLVEDMARFKATEAPGLIRSRSAQNMIKSLSQRLSGRQIFEFADRIQQYRHFLISRNNPNERLLLEDLLIDWSKLFRSNV